MGREAKSRKRSLFSAKETIFIFFKVKYLLTESVQTQRTSMRRSVGRTRILPPRAWSIGRVYLQSEGLGSRSDTDHFPAADLEGASPTPRCLRLFTRKMGTFELVSASLPLCYFLLPSSSSENYVCLGHGDLTFPCAAYHP